MENKQFVILSPNQMKNKKLVKEFKSAGVLVVESKKVPPTSKGERKRPTKR